MEKVVKKTKLKKVYTPKERKQRAVDICLLVLLLVSFAAILLTQILALMPAAATLAMDIVLAAIYGIFFTEFVYRMLSITKISGKGGVKQYFKFNHAEPIYFVAMLIVLPLVFIFRDNIWISLLKWVTIFKAPNIFRHFKDVIVFNVVVKFFLVLLIIFFVVPFLNVIAVALSSPNPGINIIPIGFTFYSFQYVLADKALYQAFLVSLVVTICGTLISVISMAMAAYPLSKKEMPLRKTMLIFFMIVMLFSGGMAPNIILINSIGLLDSVWALILPTAVMVFHLLLLKGFFEDIPVELEESAKLDGANNYRILISIIIPVAIPMMATVILFTAINYWNNLNSSILYIVGNKDLYPIPMFIKNTLSRNPQDIALENPELLSWWNNIQMAYVFISIIPIACLYPFVLKFLTKGVTAGAVKG